MTESEIHKIINRMQTKSCKLDAMLTAQLKLMLSTCLPIITQIVNLSLSGGIFADEWKTSVVRPLLKKAGLDLTDKNYRLVSNLSFLSKIVERATNSHLIVMNTHSSQTSS